MGAARAIAFEDLVTTVGTARIASHYVQQHAGGLPEGEQEKWLEISYYLEHRRQRAANRLRRLERLEGRMRHPTEHFVERVQTRLHRLIRDVVEHL